MPLTDPSTMIGAIAVAAIGLGGGPAIASAALAATGVPAPAPAPARDSTLLQGLEAWWQFDWAEWFDNEVTDGPALVSAPGATVLFETISGGAERALDTSPTGAAAARASASNELGHWSAPTDGVVTVLIVVRPDGFPVTGEPQTLLSKWADGPFTQWRIDVDPIAEAAELTVETIQGSESLSAGGLVIGERLLVLASIAAPTTGLPTTIEVIGSDGMTRGSASMMLPALYQTDLAPHLEVGRSAEDASRSADAAIDIVAGWSRALTAAERNELAGLAASLRYATVSGTIGLRPPGFLLERVSDVLEGDVRHVVMGDSFCSTLGFNRVFPAVLKVHDFSPLTSMAAGVRSSQALIRTISPVNDPTGENPRTIDFQESYACEWMSGVSQDYYGLPVNSLAEIRGHAEASPGPNGVLWEMQITNNGMSDGATGSFSATGDRIRMRVLHRRLSSDALSMESIRMAAPSDPVGGGVVVDLLSGDPRQINATPEFVEQVVGVNIATSLQVRETEPGAFAAAESRLANLAGVMAWKVDEAGDRLPGTYYTSLNDSSWTLQDFSQNVEGDGSGNGKSYSLEQLRRWLTVTTLDPQQAMVFWWYVDMEPIGDALVASRTQGMIDLADEACQLEGLPRPRHILVVPHTHQRGSRTTDGLTLAFEDFRSGYQQVAATPSNDHVAVFSIRDANDAQFFDGRPESVQWLADRGYDAFEYGIYTGKSARNLVAQADLLDQSDVHPADQSAAAFYASFLIDGILNAGAEPACPADLDENGAVDFIDLLSVLEVWGPCIGCSPDLDGDGLVGFTDLLAVVSAWGPCPE